MRIRRLSDHLVNQIAAGEVVERPASALKEIIENSLDAGARRIDVSLKEGGVAEMLVIDDGEGMTRDDLALCVERHTTSKLRDERDLEAIGTFGFRGEALSSIASVAELEIKTRPRDQANGFAITVSYGEKREIEPVGCPPGTQLAIRGLFARTPARQKFLRSRATELSHCSRFVKELALGAPGVSFSLSHGGSRLARYTTPDRLSRFRETLKFRWEPLHLVEENDGLALEAFLSPPNVIAERGELYLFINGRAVRNRGLLAAVRTSYAEMLGDDHDPSGVLYLNIRHDWVDVNVHPQKLEVRCLRQDILYGWLLAAVRKAISRSPEVKAAANAMIPGAHPVQVPFAVPAGTATIRQVGRVKDYLVCEDPDGVLLVDPRALRERLQRDLITRSLATGPLPSRPLAIPIVLKADAEARASALASLGFEWESYGDGDVALKAVPARVAEDVAAQVFAECLAGDPVAVLARQNAGSDRPLDMGELEGLERLTRPESDSRPVAFRLSFHSIEKHFETV